MSDFIFLTIKEKPGQILDKHLKLWPEDIGIKINSYNNTWKSNYFADILNAIKMYQSSEKQNWNI